MTRRLVRRPQSVIALSLRVVAGGGLANASYERQVFLRVNDARRGLGAPWPRPAGRIKRTARVSADGR